MQEKGDEGGRGSRAAARMLMTPACLLDTMATLVDVGGLGSRRFPGAGAGPRSPGVWLEGEWDYWECFYLVPWGALCLRMAEFLSVLPGVLAGLQPSFGLNVFSVL